MPGVYRIQKMNETLFSLYENDVFLISLSRLPFRERLESLGRCVQLGR